MNPTNKGKIMSEKSETIKARIQMFKDDYALPIITGAAVGMAILVTSYAGAQAGANAAVKRIKVNVKMVDSEGNPITLISE